MTGEDVAFGSDEYYNEIIADRQGKKFEQQRDTWREGTDFDFEANFYGKTQEAEEESIEVDSAVAATDSDEDDSNSNSKKNYSKVIDTEIIT